MLNGYKILTVTHHKTNVKNISNFIIKTADNEILVEKLRQLQQKFSIPEIYYVATCNRVMYFIYEEQARDRNFALAFLQEINPNISEGEVASAVTFYKGENAIDHLFKVASSIDSMVIGEREIFRQMREAYNLCSKHGLTGDNLRVAYQRMVVAAKEVYANTKIGEKSISIVSLAMQKLLKSRLTKDARIVVVGAGQTNRLLAKFLEKYEYHNITVYNRTLFRAENIADKFSNGRAFALEKIAHHTGGFDCLVVCTSAPEAIIDEAIYLQLLGDDQDRKIIVDLAIPHNVEAKVVQHFPVEYIEIEGLRSLAKEHLSFRETEVYNANSLLYNALYDFVNLHHQRQIERAMQSVPAEIKAIKDHALNELFYKEVNELDPNARALVEKMLTYMERRCIGIPMEAARAVASE